MSAIEVGTSGGGDARRHRDGDPRRACWCRAHGDAVVEWEYSLVRYAVEKSGTSVAAGQAEPTFSADYAS